MRKNVTYWIISDTHFGHDKLVKTGLKLADEDEKVLYNMTKTIKDKDILIHLGDVSFYRDKYWHDELYMACAGKMILVRGNHDRKTLSWYYERGWDFVCDEFKLDIYGERIVFTHEPIDLDYTDSSMSIHGHLHDDKHRGEIISPDTSRLVYNNLVNLRSLIGK